MAINQEWSHWKPRALRHVERLETQIEFLKDKFYAGRGSHYSLLPDLQETKRQITALETGSDWIDGCIAMIRLNYITKTIKDAERSVFGLGAGSGSAGAETGLQ